MLGELTSGVYASIEGLKFKKRSGGLEKSIRTGDLGGSKIEGEEICAT